MKFFGFHSNSSDKDISLSLIGITALSSLLFYKLYKRVSENTRKKELIDLLHRRAKEVPFLLHSSTHLASLIRSGELKAVDVVQECINQARLVEPYINSIADECFEAALREAETVDKLVSSLKSTYPKRLEQLSTEKPLLGVPFFSKECFEVPGLSFTSGLVALKGNKGKAWSPAVWRLKQSGAILLGTANMSEAGMWFECFNNVYGCSNNPFDLSRTTGGSSGGGAALVSSLVVPFSLTGDVGGSTRIPALFNGLFGHKASGGSTPGVRNLNNPRRMMERYCQIGAVSRHINDIQTIQRILSGPITQDEVVELNISGDENPNSHLHESFSWETDKNVTFDKSVKVLNLITQPRGSTPFTKIEPDQLRARERIKAAFVNNGNTVVDIQIKEFEKCFDWYTTMLFLENEDVTFAEKLSKGRESVINIWLELIRYVFSLGYASDFTLPSLIIGVIDKLGKAKKKLVEGEVQKFSSFKKHLYQMLGTPLDQSLSNAGNEEKIILLVNSLPFVAPKHGSIQNIITLGNLAATAIFNVLELPATAAPTGIGSQGLPTGAQM